MTLLPAAVLEVPTRLLVLVHPAGHDELCAAIVDRPCPEDGQAFPGEQLRQSQRIVRGAGIGDLVDELVVVGTVLT